MSGGNEVEGAIAYRWSPPIYRPGDRIVFEWRHGLWLDGEVLYLETYYRQEGEAWHSYKVRADRHSTVKWVSEKRMRRPCDMGMQSGRPGR